MYLKREHKNYTTLLSCYTSTLAIWIVCAHLSYGIEYHVAATRSETSIRRDAFAYCSAVNACCRGQWPTHKGFDVSKGSPMDLRSWNPRKTTDNLLWALKLLQENGYKGWQTLNVTWEIREDMEDLPRHFKLVAVCCWNPWSLDLNHEFSAWNMAWMDVLKSPSYQVMSRSD